MFSTGFGVLATNTSPLDPVRRRWQVFLQNTRLSHNIFFNSFLLIMTILNNVHLQRFSISRATLDSPSTRIWMVWTYACRWQPNTLLERTFREWEKKLFFRLVNLGEEKKRHNAQQSACTCWCAKNKGNIKLSNNANILSCLSGSAPEHSAVRWAVVLLKFKQLRLLSMPSLVGIC